MSRRATTVWLSSLKWSYYRVTHRLSRKNNAGGQPVRFLRSPRLRPETLWVIMRFLHQRPTPGRDGSNIMKASKVVTAVLGTVMALGLMVGTASASDTKTKTYPQSDGTTTTATVVTTQGRGADAGKTVKTVTVNNSGSSESTTIVHKTDDGVKGEGCPPEAIC